MVPNPIFLGGVWFIIHRYSVFHTFIWRGWVGGLSQIKLTSFEKTVTFCDDPLVADDENLTTEHKLYQLFIPILEASSVLSDVISIFTSAFSSVFKFESLYFVFYLSYFFNTIIFKISCNLYCILIVIMCCHVCWYFCKKRNYFTIVYIFFKLHYFSPDSIRRGNYRNMWTLHNYLKPYIEKSFEATKVVIRIRMSKKTDNTMAKWKSTKGQITIYITYTSI
jgi:hypothetical protein